MAMSDDAVAFSVIPPGQQVRLEDRVSYVYLEHSSIAQDRTGVVAYSSDQDGMVRQEIQIPVGSLALIILGPGTSITHAAATSCTRAGATILFAGGGGVPAYTLATPLTSSARWSIAQAKLVSNVRFQRDAAMTLYKRQFGMEDQIGGSIRSMRGIEGQRMRLLYRQLAKQHGVTGFKRNVEAEDGVNIGLNIANSIMYGCAASACAAIGVNPALGIIHRGDARSLLYDLADLYKPTVTLPIAFECANADDVPFAVRRAVRKALVRDDILVGMLDALMEVLRPHLPDRDDDRLIGDVLGEEVPGHVQYGSKGGQ